MRYFFPFIALFTLLLTTSCDEKEEVGEYDNWQERNALYVDSIADLARNNSQGWTQIKGYVMGDSLGNNAANEYYLYVQKLETGKGRYDESTGDYVRITPSDKDSVRVHYCGRLIPTDLFPTGQVFDKSYNSATLNEETDVPALMATIGTIPGFATALEYMTEGDRWIVVIPQFLAYGSQTSTSIPAYSTLIFDMKLARIYRYKIDTNTSWH